MLVFVFVLERWERSYFVLSIFLFLGYLREVVVFFFYVGDIVFFLEVEGWRKGGFGSFKYTYIVCIYIYIIWV